MNEIKPTQRPVKKPVPKKKSVDVSAILVTGAKVVGGLAVVAAIGFGAYTFLKPGEKAIWTNYDEVISTGEKILHQQTESIKNINSESPMKDDPKDTMYLSVKKIDNKDAVWFIGTSNDFNCVSGVNDKCTLDIAFDGVRVKKYRYDGGTMRTAYIVEATDLINEIKKSKEIKLSAIFKRQEMTPTEKSNWAIAHGGRYTDSFNKEHVFRVDGLVWK